MLFLSFCLPVTRKMDKSFLFSIWFPVCPDSSGEFVAVPGCGDGFAEGAAVSPGSGVGVTVPISLLILKVVVISASLYNAFFCSIYPSR